MIMYIYVKLVAKLLALLFLDIDKYYFGDWILFSRFALFSWASRLGRKRKRKVLLNWEQMRQTLTNNLN